jgi:hypothetical protein
MLIKKPQPREIYEENLVECSPIKPDFTVCTLLNTRLILNFSEVLSNTNTVLRIRTQPGDPGTFSLIACGRNEYSSL